MIQDLRHLIRYIQAYKSISKDSYSNVLLEKECQKKRQKRKKRKKLKKTHAYRSVSHFRQNEKGIFESEVGWVCFFRFVMQMDLRPHV